MKAIMHLRKYSGTIFFWVLWGAFSVIIVGYRLALSYNWIGWDGFIRQDYGKPFVTRALIVWLASFLQMALHVTPAGIFLSLESLAFTLSGWIFAKYINTFLSDQNISRILSFSLYFIIPFELILPRYQPLWYPFDAYALLFSLLGLWLIRQDRFGLYYLLFAVATMNRETTCFLTMVFLLVNWEKMPKRKIVLHSLVQSSIWLIIKLWLDWIFAGQAGVVFQQQYLSNIKFVTDMNYDMRFPVAYEMIFRPAYLLGNFGFIYLLIIVFRTELDNMFLRRSVFVMIPFVLSMLYVANIYEYRIFGETIPFVLMPSLYILVRLLRKRELGLSTS